MAELLPMYPGVANSPETFLKEALTIDGTIMYLADGSVLGEIPTLAVIGEGQQAETVLVTSTRSDGGYAIERGVEGPQKAWTKATNVARNWTNKDYEALRSNVTAINTEVETKVDKVAGKGLSTNDYNDAAKAKVDAIPPDPKYTDTVPDLSPYATKNGDLYQEYNERRAAIEQLKTTHNLDVRGLRVSINNIKTTHATDIQSVRTDYAKDIKAAKDTLAEDINSVRTAHEADIKRLESQKLNKTDVVNDLTTGGVDKALSAEQGKILEDTKLDKTDIKTRLADMEEDSEHRTVTDAEKKAWSEGGGIDKQYLYDILMGESLVTKKAGKWPEVHGKPTSIEDSAFSGNQLTSVVIPPSVTSIGDYAFEENQLTSVVIPPSVTRIRSYTFYKNKLTSVVIPPSVTDIFSDAFRENQLTSVVIPPSVTYIGDRVFQKNALSEVKVPKNCDIENNAFDPGVNIIRY